MSEVARMEKDDLRPGQLVTVSLYDGTTVIRRIAEVKGDVVALCSLVEYARAAKEGRQLNVLDFPVEIVTPGSRVTDAIPVTNGIPEKFIA